MSDDHEDKLLAEIFLNFAGMSLELDVVLHLVMQLSDFISTGWRECIQIGERLKKKVIKSCRGRVNFGGYIFANFGKMYI